MKRLLLLSFCAAVLSLRTFAEEPAAEHGAPGEHAAEAHEEGDKYIWWKWANFAILAVALGYMLNKALPPFFAGRTAEIQKGIAEAAKAKAEADQRAAAMQQRLAALGAEIEQIKTTATPNSPGKAIAFAPTPVSRWHVCRLKRSRKSLH